MRSSIILSLLAPLAIYAAPTLPLSKVPSRPAHDSPPILGSRNKFDFNAVLMPSRKIHTSKGSPSPVSIVRIQTGQYFHKVALECLRFAGQARAVIVVLTLTAHASVLLDASSHCAALSRYVATLKYRIPSTGSCFGSYFGKVLG